MTNNKEVKGLDWKYFDAIRANNGFIQEFENTCRDYANVLAKLKQEKTLANYAKIKKGHFKVDWLEDFAKLIKEMQKEQDNTLKKISKK